MPDAGRAFRSSIRNGIVETEDGVEGLLDLGSPVEHSFRDIEKTACQPARFGKCQPEDGPSWRRHAKEDSVGEVATGNEPHHVGLVRSGDEHLAGMDRIVLPVSREGHASLHAIDDFDTMRMDMFRRSLANRLVDGTAQDGNGICTVRTQVKYAKFRCVDVFGECFYHCRHYSMLKGPWL